MYIFIKRKSFVGAEGWHWSAYVGAKDFWADSHIGLSVEEGYEFVRGVHTVFDNPLCDFYDPYRCGVFADWLQDNEDRLLAQVEEQDRPLAAERLSQLRDWLRSGLQVQEV